MPLQVVSVIVAPFGITRIASAVANCSDGPGLWPACHPQEPWIPEGGWPSTAPRFASLGPEGGASPFGLQRTLPSDSRARSTAAALSSHPGTSVGVAALVQRQVCFLDSVQGLEVAATTLRAEREDVATPMRHRREPPRGGSVQSLCRPGQRTGRDQDCDQKSHRAIVPILQRYAVTSAALGFALCCSVGMQ